MNNFTKFDLRLTSSSERSNLFEVYFTRSIDCFDFEAFAHFLYSCSPFMSFEVDYIITNLRCFLSSEKSCIQLKDDNPFNFDIYLFVQKL